MKNAVESASASAAVGAVTVALSIPSAGQAVRGQDRFERIYQRFSGERRGFDEIAYESRMLIMNTTLAADLDVLATRLARIAAGNRFTRDYTASGLKKCANSCPVAGGSIVHQGLLGKTITVDVDGSSSAKWTSSNGKSGTVDLKCE